MDNPWNKIWEDQASFNRLIRPDPETFEDKSAVTSELVLAITDEAHELLRTVKWKKHRRLRRYTANMAQTTEEIVDMFKDLITIAQAWGITPEMLAEGYWAKSAVNRQRYSEEWVKDNIDGPVIILDLDNVLCDYTRGFGEFLLPHLIGMSPDVVEPIRARIRNRQYIDAKTCGLDEAWFGGVKHGFRVNGHKRLLEPMPGAAEFVSWCRERAMVILLTARPIGEYPNMLTDTVFWLNRHNIEVDHIWWGADKGRVVELEAIRDHVRFAVDDALEHCHQYNDVGVNSYWLNPYEVSARSMGQITHARDFKEIMEREKGR